MSSKFMACFVYLFWFWHFAFFFCRLYRCNLVICTIPCMSVYKLFSVIFYFILIILKAVYFIPVWFYFILCDSYEVFFCCALFFFFYTYIHTYNYYISLIQIQPRQSIAKTCTLQSRNVQTLQNLLHLPSFWISIRSNLG